jgi:hypothetical protein
MGGAYLAQAGQSLGTGIGDLLKDYSDTQAKVAGADLIINHAHALGQANPGAPGSITPEDWFNYQKMGAKQRIAFAGGQASLFANDIQRQQADYQQKEALARTGLYGAQTADLTAPPQMFNLSTPPSAQYTGINVPPNPIPATPSTFGMGPPAASQAGLGMGLGAPVAPPTSMDLGGAPASLDLATQQTMPTAPTVDLGGPAVAPQGYQRVTPGATQPVVSYRGQLHMIEPGFAPSAIDVSTPSGKHYTMLTTTAKSAVEAAGEADKYVSPRAGQPIYDPRDPKKLLGIWDEHGGIKSTSEDAMAQLMQLLGAQAVKEQGGDGSAPATTATPAPAIAPQTSINPLGGYTQPLTGTPPPIGPAGIGPQSAAIATGAPNASIVQSFVLMARNALGPGATPQQIAAAARQLAQQSGYTQAA